MKRVCTAIVATTLFCLMYAGNACAQPSETSSELPNTHSEFKSWSDDDLNGLLFEDNTGISLITAWERMWRETNRTDEKSDAVERYLGFVEGRLGVSIPSSWEHELRNARFSESEPELVVLGPVDDMPFGRASKSLSISISLPFFFEQSDTSWHLVGDDTNIILRTFDETTQSLQIGDSIESCDLLAISTDGDHGAVLGFSVTSPRPYTIVRVNADAKLLWKSRVICRSAEPTHGYSGIIRQSTEIVTTESAVLVFGITRGFAYINGFDIETGDCLFRFSSYDWQGVE